MTIGQLILNLQSLMMTNQDITPRTEIKISSFSSSESEILRVMINSGKIFIASELEE